MAEGVAMTGSSAGVRFFVDDAVLAASKRNERSDRWQSPWRVVVLGVLALAYTVTAFCTWNTEATPPLHPWIAMAGNVSFAVGLVGAVAAVAVAARTTLIRHLHPIEFAIFLFSALWLLLVGGLLALVLVVGVSC
jgi:hypothetical protein